MYVVWPAESVEGFLLKIPYRTVGIIMSLGVWIIWHSINTTFLDNNYHLFMQLFSFKCKIKLFRLYFFLAKKLYTKLKHFLTFSSNLCLVNWHTSFCPLKRIPIPDSYACVSNGNVKAQKLSQIPPTLPP